MRFPAGTGDADRKFWGGLVLAAAILFAIQQNSGGTPFYRDRLYYFIPQYDACRASLAAGEVPLWNPFVFCGQPLLATWQVALGSPLALPFLIWPFETAVQVFWFAALACAAGGMYAFGLSAGLPPFGAAVAALIYAGAGPLRSLGEWPNIVAGLAYLPALLAAITAFYRGQTGSFPLLAIFLAMQALAGQPRQVMISGLAAVGWLAALAAAGKPRRIPVWGLAAAASAALCVTSLQLFPSFELLLFSERLADGVPPETAKEGFLSFRDLIGLISAKFWGREGTLLGPTRALQPRLYVGALCLGLAAMGLFRAPRVLRLFAVFTIPVAAVLAISEPVASLVLALAKAAGLLRYMGHWILACFPAFCLLAGTGAQTTARKTPFPGGILLPAAVVAVLVIPALIPAAIRALMGESPIQVAGVNHESAIRDELVVSASVFLAAWLLARNKSAWLTACLPILIFVDFSSSMHGFEAKAPPASFSRPAALDRWKIGNDRIFSPVWLPAAFYACPPAPRSIASRYQARQQLLAPNVPQSYGIRNASGYEPFCLAAADDMFGEYWKGVDGILPALQVAGVRWAIAPDTHRIDSLHSVGEIMPGWSMYRVPDPAPMAALVPYEVGAENWRSLLRAPRRGEACIVDESMNRMTICAQARADSMLYIATFWMPGWRFEIDGAAPRPASWTASGFIAIRPPEGKSRILFTYAPFPFAVGLLVASVSLAGMLTFAAFSGSDGAIFASGTRRRREYKASA